MKTQYLKLLLCAPLSWKVLKPAASPTGSGDRNRRKPPRLRPPHRKASTPEASVQTFRCVCA
ncbi:hypothetical protein [Nostoc sp. PA-18-2419]|uniref:hypothetical protein n=1 Tax=Nostoc sp. PA-18-2419 TaxID=2575443 RepID=UPI001108D37B|nr:hypothetical protein [Nostoc sp. PA-18-2419]